MEIATDEDTAATAGLPSSQSRSGLPSSIKCTACKTMHLAYRRCVVTLLHKERLWRVQSPGRWKPQRDIAPTGLRPAVPDAEQSPFERLPPPSFLR